MREKDLIEKGLVKQTGVSDDDEKLYSLTKKGIKCFNRKIKKLESLK